MPLATPPVFDGWVTNQPSHRDRPVAKTLEPDGFESASNHRTPTLVGQSPVMRKLFSVIERVAPTEASVLITGATGTGKELAARAIHNMSPRRDEAFVDINCSAIPETLIEAELFGHQRGTFTGAHENRSGLFEKASGGTLFLDEVALNLSAQAKLLRVLQERTVRRIGARANIAIDVRIISATNCDLAQAVASGRFRPDLYYRLRVLPLHLPELCTRTGDISLLVDHFLRMKSERQGRASVPCFTPEAMRTLNEYPWPGNVRELENVIEYALALGLEDELGVGDLPPEIVDAQRQPSTDNFREVLEAYMNDTVPLAEVEKRYILSVLQQFGGNQVRAAAALGIDRSKLYRRLKQYGVMAVRFLQEEDLNGMQLLSRREVMEGNGTGH
jgi:DNA-binding NtrC family response regulator